MTRATRLIVISALIISFCGAGCGPARRGVIAPEEVAARNATSWTVHSTPSQSRPTPVPTPAESWN